MFLRQLNILHHNCDETKKFLLLQKRFIHVSVDETALYFYKWTVKH